MNLDLSELVEINDDPNRKTKKYMNKDGNIVYGPFQDWDTDNVGEKATDEEIAKLVAELEAMTANNPPPQIDREQAIQDSIDEHSKILMFDYGTGKVSNVQAMADFYGWAIVRQIEHEIEYSYNHRLDDQKPGHISKKLWQRIKDSQTSDHICKRMDQGRDLCYWITFPEVLNS